MVFSVAEASNLGCVGNAGSGVAQAVSVKQPKVIDIDFSVASVVNGCSHPIHTEKHRFRPIPSLNLPLFSMQGMWFWRFLPNLWAWFATGTTGQCFS